MGSARLLLRWSVRDLRSRWVLVTVIALIIALGTGLAAGLGSMRDWRVASNDASYRLLNAHDLRVSLPEGARVAEARLRGIVAGIPQADAVTGAQPRLVTSAQIDATRPGRTRIVPGRLVGLPVERPGSGVDQLHVSGGRALRPTDADASVGILESVFAAAGGLPESGQVIVGGTTRIDYVGVGVTPDYFIASRPGAALTTAESYAVLFVPLATAQRLTGAVGQVNEIALTVRPGTDLSALEKELTDAFDARLGGAGATFTRRADEVPHRLLYTDAKNDQRIYDVFAYLVLAAATLAAFNLVGRVVEAQRREIGIGMALGVDGRHLAIRPLLLGAEIALLGALLGVGIGLAFNAVFRRLLADLLPLPVLVTPFQPVVFGRGALIGFLLPFAAAAYPVWRAVRVTPIEAIRVGARAARGAGWAAALRRVPAPGGSLAHMPLRNTLRAPRRTLLTALAIGAIIGAVVAFSGMIDSFRATIAQGREAVEGDRPTRLVAELDGFHPVGSGPAAAVAASGVASLVEPGIRVGAEVSSTSASVSVVLELIDPASRAWRPRIVSGRFPAAAAGLVISTEAAHDLGVGVGDEVALRHPRRDGQVIGLARTRTRIVGIHPNPFRFQAYMDAGQASLLGLAGLANSLSVIPSDGVSQEEATRAIAPIEGVAIVEPANATLKAIDDRIDDFVAVLLFAEAVILVLAALIAANAAGINADERSREHATMMAFGLPVRTPILLAMGEGLVVGLIATAAGLGLGSLLLRWFVGSLFPETLPELGIVVSISVTSLAIAIIAGVAATALAPLLTYRRLRRLDIPSALRVVE